jgi:amino acid transporter
MDESVILALFIFTCMVAATGILLSIVREIHARFSKKKQPKQNRIWLALSLIGNVSLLLFFLPIVINSYFPPETHVDSNRELQLMYALTAEEMTDGLVSIEVVDRFPLWTFKDEKNTSGLYAAVMRKIYILKDADIPSVYAHELGHHVWHYQLGNRAREIYIEEYENDIYRPTAYANTSVSEDFADTFALMMLGDPTQRIRNTSWRHAFMIDNVFVLFADEEQ